MSINTGLPIVTDGLVFLVDAANDLGGNVTDTKSLPDPTEIGTFTNGASVVSGAFDFDGVDDYVAFGNNLSANYAQWVLPFSIECWINPSSLGGSFGTVVVGNNHFPINGDNGGWRIMIWTDATLVMAFGDSGMASSTSVKSVGTIPLSEWTQCVMTYDGSQTAAGIKLYINNALDSATWSTSAPLNNTTAPFSIARGGAVTTDLFNGVIASVKLYDKELIVAEIDQNYQAQKHKFE